MALAAILILACLLTLLIALCDTAFFRIPNKLLFVLVPLWALFGYLNPHIIIFKNLIVFFVFLTICLLLFRFNMVGGGDAKFIPLCVLWTGIESLNMFLFLLIGFSLVLAGWTYLAKTSFYSFSKSIRMYILQKPFLHKIFSNLIEDIDHSEYSDYENNRMVPYGLPLSMSLIITLIWTGVSA